MLTRQRFYSLTSMAAPLSALALAACVAGDPQGGRVGLSVEALTAGLTVQRGTNGTVSDATINAQQMRKNLGPNDKLIVSKKSEALLRFDVGAIPANAIIDSATLTLYMHGRENG